MDLVSTVKFPADPVVVFGMLTDPVFQDSVATRTHCVRHEFGLTGARVNTLRVVESPDKIAKFVGPTLDIQEVVHWDEPAADGGRRGRFTVTVPGKPLSWTGTTALVAEPDGSTLTYSGELTVSIPIIGKSLERQAAEALEALVSVQEDVGARYLGH